FFFQAEDGIRDFHVTGVQTCALPILDKLIGWVRLNSVLLVIGVLYYTEVGLSSQIGFVMTKNHNNWPLRCPNLVFKDLKIFDYRSEERRVGKECKYR